MKRLLIAIAIVIAIVGGIVWVLKAPTFKGASPGAHTRTVVGVIRTGGLTSEEKEQFDLAEADYQITQLASVETSEPEGYFLITGDRKLEMLLGHCYRATGAIPDGWRERSTSDTYGRGVLVVERLEEMDATVCPIPSGFDSFPSEEERMTFTGKLAYGQRPAPDIAYDYQLELEKPYTLETNASGSPQEIDTLTIVPTSETTYRDIERHIDTTVTIEGQWAWGYAESRVFRVSRLVPILR